MEFEEGDPDLKVTKAISITGGNLNLNGAGLKVEEVVDYKNTAKTGLPSSNVLSFKLENGNGVVARPSGTEPKLKFYFTAVAPDMDAAGELYKKMRAFAESRMEA